jgi:SnoaL-like domain
MSAENEIGELRHELESVRHELGMLQDVQAIRKLQFTYGYLMDKCLFPAIVELFAEDAELHFLGGIYRGKAGARRLYGGATGLNGPVDGLLFEHLIVQDIVDVAPDRKRAWGRFRTFMQGGVHETHPNPPPNIPSQFWEGGVYENEYVKDGGVWKIKVFNYRVVWQADFDKGWAHSAVDPLMVSSPVKTFPENPRGPDEIVAAPAPRWPKQGIHPFHFAHPVTGEKLG